ncbi:hypothetical protein V6U78_08320 [Marinospirillum sp. MEB164]|uniref:PAS fold-containing protein n=1 Tax=Marinospirillum alkalitolerans TaxID=3123374 RepID=A0ABW8PXK4_9GAMM
MEMLSIGSSEPQTWFCHLELSALHLTSVLLDAEGRILEYQTSLPALAEKMPTYLGRHFFTEVAPSTNHAEFRGRFEEGVRLQRLNVIFESIFKDQGYPAKTVVHMRKGPESDTYQLLFSYL